MSKSEISIRELFNRLDVNRDGKLSRAELRHFALSMEWHWYHAPLYAVLDLLTIRAPLSVDSFISYMNQISRDPDGPYGRVLLQSPLFTGKSSKHSTAAPCDTASEREAHNSDHEDILALLERLIGNEAAETYGKILKDLDEFKRPISSDKAGLLLIDPQCSFTSGIWMKSICSRAEIEVEPIRLAFENCSRLLYKHYGQMEVMFTRCPFPPGSYEWDERIRSVISDSQFYFIKPGNSVMWPPTNGFREWVQGLLTDGKKTLVMGGCTLNSCVRVSSTETLRFFQHQGLQVVVDVSICGTRAKNYEASDQYGGISSAASAIRYMRESGVKVVQQVTFL